MNLCIGRHGERSDYLEKIHAGFSGQVAVYIRSWGEMNCIPLVAEYEREVADSMWS